MIEKAGRGAKVVTFVTVAFYLVSAWQFKVTLPVRLSFIGGLVLMVAYASSSNFRAPLNPKVVLWLVLSAFYLVTASFLGREIVANFVAADFLSLIAPLVVVACLKTRPIKLSDATYLVTRLAFGGLLAAIAAKYLFPFGNRFWMVGPLTLAYVASRAVNSSGFKERLISLALLGASVYLAFDSGSRTAALQLFLALGLALFSFRSDSSRSRLAIILFLGLCVVGSIAYPQSRQFALEAVDESRAVEITTGQRRDVSAERRLEEMDQVLRYSSEEWGIVENLIGEGHGATYVSGDALGPTNSTRTASGRIHAVHLGLPRTFLRYGLLGVVVLVGLGVACLQRARALLASRSLEVRVLGSALLLYAAEYLIGNPTVDLGFVAVVGLALVLSPKVLKAFELQQEASPMTSRLSSATTSGAPSTAKAGWTGGSISS